ncbi:AAA family ATPase [Acetobacter papayae]|uniref:AAA family ATPase n=1 Tax=Acetobacter papayae TaxID=1076592 RepID=UPI00047174CD|nr:hypothetical protein [Acetobacter papayae]
MSENGKRFTETTEQGARVLVIVQDMETEAMMADFLNTVCPNEGRLLRLGMEQAQHYLSNNTCPPYLVLDIRGSTDPLASVRQFKGMVPPDVTMMLIGDRDDVNFYRSITHGYGIAEYLYPPLHRNLLVRFFGDIILHGQKETTSVGGGSLVTLCGVRPGVGASTLLANLGWYVAQEARRHTLLIDFDTQASRLGVLLNAEDNLGLLSVLEEPERMDSLLVERSIQSVSDRLKLLSSLGPVGQKPRLAPSTLKSLLGFVRGQFHFVMARMDWSEGETFASLAGQAQQLMLVMDPTLACMRDTLRLLAVLPQLHLPTKPVLVLNQFGRPGTLSMDEVSKSLGCPPDIVIPYLPRECGEAEINGEPVARDCKPYHDAISRIAHESLSLHRVARTGAEERGLVGRVVNTLLGAR